MRERLARVIFGTGVAAALVAAAFWMSFIWSFDWGHFGSRAWGLWFFFAFLIGTVLVALVVILFFGWISTLVDPE